MVREQFNPQVECRLQVLCIQLLLAVHERAERVPSSAAIFDGRTMRKRCNKFTRFLDVTGGKLSKAPLKTCEERPKPVGISRQCLVQELYVLGGHLLQIEGWRLVVRLPLWWLRWRVLLRIHLALFKLS